MAAEPCGTLRVMPPLGDGQVDSLCQRFDRAWHDGRLNLTVDQAGAVLFAFFPEQFDGDPYEAKAAAAAIRKVTGGVRPMANGYRTERKIWDVCQCTAKRRKRNSRMVYDVTVTLQPATYEPDDSED